MNRKDFLKEMCTSVFKTVKYAYEPFFHDDLQKVEEFVDKSLGVMWRPMMIAEAVSANLELKFIEGNPIIVLLDDAKNLQAFKGICPECSNIITVTTLFATGKCLNCEKEYNFKTKQGYLQLKSLPVKKKDNMFYIGLEKHKKPGVIRA